MLNFYPWGLSINIVKPINIKKTKVQFLSYVYDESKLDLGAGASLDKVEREDEFVVEGVQKVLTQNFIKLADSLLLKKKVFIIFTLYYQTHITHNYEKIFINLYTYY